MGKATKTETIEGSGELLTYTQAAITLGVSESSVSRMVTSGKLPSIRAGARRMIRRSDLNEFMANL